MKVIHDGVAGNHKVCHTFPTLWSTAFGEARTPSTNEKLVYKAKDSRDPLAVSMRSMHGPAYHAFLPLYTLQ